MKPKWRLLDTGTLPAASNMALEWVLLTSSNHGWAPNTIHFLEFTKCVLLGYHQAVELEVEEEYCKNHGIEINRRISGGGCIYMDKGQLGWEIIAHRGTAGFSPGSDDTYKRLCQSAIAGLAKLGVKAAYRPVNDIEVQGRKISGTGGTDHGRSFIFHGSILVDFDPLAMINCLKLPISKLEDKQVDGFKRRVTSIREVLGCIPSMDAVKDAMAQGFEEVLGIQLVEGGLTPREKDLLARELPWFESEEWIRRNRIPNQDSMLTTADYKAPGGLIRVSLLLDNKRHIIKSAFITGDFFTYPTRAILDLESALKNTSCRPTAVERRIKDFFNCGGVKVLGIEPRHFYEALMETVARGSGGLVGGQRGKKEDWQR